MTRNNSVGDRVPREALLKDADEAATTLRLEFQRNSRNSQGIAPVYGI